MLSERKAEARRLALAARKAAHAAADPQADAHLRAVLGACAGRVLAGYLPIRTEIDPRGAMAAHQGPVCVPVIEAEGAPLRFRRWHPDTPLVPGPFGAPVPERGEWLEPEVVVVPLVAFDAAGGRLGYGGGFYDRTLARLRRRGPLTAIGFAYAAQELAQVPTEETDAPLDLIVTERGVLVPGAG